MEIRSIIEIQLINNITLQFFHIKKENELSEKQQYNMEVLKKNFNEDVFVIDEIETNTTLSETITAFAEDQTVNMICLVNPAHSLIEKLTHEPVIKGVSFHSPIPLLILPI